ncbi:Cyclin-dependent kinases regulatory subunit [Nosema bombycis CQ1]|uniref:Cyclin-dependent kinases regulatory subunit n=1 Tax=Nosema bombycis (strain CQ1 / CVCC 102059) TaxID=578461 RepID=R0MKB6_NOSB1|nr:Cyclin-dependent kinases regulatory subunit [Nosema bombycis CQ1]|eukprot:EOB14685.1 Cyclin-dependent kinases regulatory subunit [Nosema bombycis CQ1]
MISQNDNESQIYYSEPYENDQYIHRHVFLPKALLKKMPKNKLLSETEWRRLGVEQSTGWEHFMIHAPEPHILLFRKHKNKKI